MKSVNLMSVKVMHDCIEQIELVKRPSFTASAFVALVLNNLVEGPCLRIVFVQKVVKSVK